MKKKLLFVIGMFAGGGAEKVLVNMVNQMDLSKYDITIYSVFDTGRDTNLKEGIKIIYSFKVGGNSNNEIKKNNIKAKFINLIFTYGWKYMPMRLFYKWAIKDKYDYEIAYAEGIPFKIVAASDNKKSIKYGWIHIDLSVHRRATEFFRSRNQELSCYSKMKNIVFVSDYAKEQFIKKYGFSDKCVTKYNLNENEKISSLAKLPIEDVREHDLLFVTVGRLHDQKGYDRLLETVFDISKQNRNFEIWIVGDGDQRENYQQFIANKKIEDIVKLKGFKSNPYAYIQQCDWFIASSRYEGFSTVVSEAFILRKPVMVTDCCGMGELTEDGKYGIIVENNTMGIKEGLERIINMSDSEYQRYKKLAVERSTFFDSKRRLREIEELF